MCGEGVQVAVRWYLSGPSFFSEVLFGAVFRGNRSDHACGGVEVIVWFPAARVPNARELMTAFIWNPIHTSNGVTSLLLPFCRFCGSFGAPVRWNHSLVLVGCLKKTIPVQSADPPFPP